MTDQPTAYPIATDAEIRARVAALRALPVRDNVDAVYALAKRLLAVVSDHALPEGARSYVDTLTDWHGERRYSASQTRALLRIERDLHRRRATAARRRGQPTVEV